MPEFRWGAFVGAAVLTPLLPVLPSLALTLLFSGHPAMIVPAAVLFSVPTGGPTYILFGLPASYLTIRRFDGTGYWLSGLAANVASAPFVFVALALFSREPVAGTAFVVGFGCIFAPVWGAIFGWLNGRFIRPRAPSSFDSVFGGDQ